MRQMAELQQFQRKVIDLEFKVKTLETSLTEKNAMVRFKYCFFDTVWWGDFIDNLRIHSCFQRKGLLRRSPITVPTVFFPRIPDPWHFGTDPLIRPFSSVTFKMSRKIIFFSLFCLLGRYFLELHLHHSSKIKSHKEVTKSWNKGFSYYFCLMTEGSGAIYRSPSRKH